MTWKNYLNEVDFKEVLMKIENHTNYQIENVGKFIQIYHRFEFYKRNYYFYLLSALFLYFAIFYFHDTIFRTISCLVALLIVVEIKSNLLPKLKLKQLIKTQPDSLKIKNNYCFFDHYVEIQNESGMDSIPYKKLSFIIESDDAIYLFINQTDSYLIDKSKFKKNQEDILNILKKEVPRYYRYEEKKYPFLYTFLKNKENE